MVRRTCIVLILLSACGLERDWEGWQQAALSYPDGASSSGGESSTGALEGSSGSSSGGTSSGGEGVAGTEDVGAGSSSTTGETTADGTTTGALPVCGDGLVNAPGEECDGEDTCVQCRRRRLIFVTSLYLQGGKINGLMGADAYCRSQALKAKNEVLGSPIVDPANFKALLSTSTQTIADRHFAGEGPYHLVNGLKVSDSFLGLFNAPLYNPINVDERSETNSAVVWTGTDVDGSPYPGIDFCLDWSDNGGSANFGDSDAVDSGWIHAASAVFNPTDCGSEAPIYCVEQE